MYMLTHEYDCMLFTFSGLDVYGNINTMKSGLNVEHNLRRACVYWPCMNLIVGGVLSYTPVGILQLPQLLLQPL